VDIIKNNPMQKLIALIIVGAIFYFLFRSLHESYSQLLEYDIQINVFRIVASFILLLLCYPLTPIVWMKILDSLNEKISFQKAFSIFYISQLGKYLPGRIWAFVGQIHLTQQEGIPAKKALVCSLLFQVLNAIGTIYAFTISFLFWDKYPLAIRLLLFFLVLIVSILFLRSDIFERAVTFILHKVLKRDARVQVDKTILAYIFTILLLSWIVFGVAYYFLICSFYPISKINGVIFAGIHAISWLIGYFTFLTPGGLGIREGVQVYMLHLFIPLPISIVIALASRIWLTIGELTVALIPLLLRIKR
jgi:uncharacterized membrane protein YbhN (UPF0104 family)